MATLEAAMPFLLKHEGGQCDNHNDPGGRTNMGVTQRNLTTFNEAHPELGFPADVFSLSVEQATEFYRCEFWKFDNIIDQNVATKIFDLGVNFGDGTEIKIVQELLGICADGHYGPFTERAINSADSETIIHWVCNAADARYKSIVTEHPSESVFLAGWLRRANDVNFDA